MSQCSEICAQWVKDTHDGPKPTEVGSEFGGRLSVSEFRATPTEAPDNERGVALAFASDAERDAFLREIEAALAARRFTNAADAFDTVKAWALEYAVKSHGGRVL